MQRHVFKVCGRRHFCLSKVDAKHNTDGKTYRKLNLAVCSHTLAIMYMLYWSVVRPQHNPWLSDLTEGVQHGLVEQSCVL